MSNGLGYHEWHVMNDEDPASLANADRPEPVAPVDNALDAPPAPQPVAPLESQIDVAHFELGESSKRSERSDGRESLALRKQYDAFVEQHHQALTWAGGAALGTIVAIESGQAIMHVGRHHFVRFDIANHLHGAVPEIGSRVTIDRDGTLTESVADHSLSLEHGLER